MVVVLHASPARQKAPSDPPVLVPGLPAVVPRCLPWTTVEE